MVWVVLAWGGMDVTAQCIRQGQAQAGEVFGRLGIYARVVVQVGVERAMVLVAGDDANASRVEAARRQLGQPLWRVVLADASQDGHWLIPQAGADRI